jgi:heat shock protein HslJ
MYDNRLCSERGEVMKFRFTLSLLLVLAAVLMSACAGVGAAPEVVETPTDEPTAEPTEVVTDVPTDAPADPTAEGTGEAVSLDGTSWLLTEINGEPALEGVEVTLIFEVGAAAGNAGCNSFGGDVTVDGGNITFGQLVSTMMLCAEDPEGLGAQEMEYLETLQAATTYRVEGDQLTIGTADDPDALVFTKTEADGTALLPDMVREQIALFVAEAMSVDAEAVEVVSVEVTEFSDSCLGLGGPAESCLTVMTPGFIVVLNVDGQEVTAHASVDGSSIRIAE